MVRPRRIPVVLVLGSYRRMLLGSCSSTPLCTWHMPSLLYSYLSTFYVGVDLPSYCATPDCFADSVVLYRTMDTSIQPAQYYSLLFHLNSSAPKANASDVYRVYRVLSFVLCLIRVCCLWFFLICSHTVDLCFIDFCLIGVFWSGSGHVCIKKKP